jgi:hypothetical protein
MTVSETGVAAAAGLLLTGPGCEADLAGRITAAAGRLAGLGGWPLRTVSIELPPSRALAELGGGRSSRCPPAWLAGLPLDPGLPLADGGSWAEALGAWRQPTALVLDADQLATGSPAAFTALLRQWKVPLLGLIQWGGPWDPDARRHDGLPWLGALTREPGQAAAGPSGEPDALLACLALSWAQLDQD